MQKCMHTRGELSKLTVKREHWPERFVPDPLFQKFFGFF